MNKTTQKLNGTERLSNSIPQFQDDAVIDFWRWAYSDLQDNTVRPIFAEWLVGKLLGLEMPVRYNWGDYDLITTEGVKIEVKSSAYLQTWKQNGLSAIRFGNLMGEPELQTPGEKPKKDFKADLYVFCVQIEQDPEKYNTLDLLQWRFYILPKKALAKNGHNSIGLSVLSKMAKELTAEQFQDEGKTQIFALRP